ncbi:MAG: Pyrrolo-quinoline quinone, partial [Actinomycetia bacterium]|nr:Pyrrolo-quinoline quinone [Actinomycetes bacterium]
MRFAPRSRRRRSIAVVTALAVVAGLIGPGPAAGDVTTVSNDNLRTAWDSAEPGLSPAAVVSSDFGQLFSTQLDGQVYAQPLVADGKLIVATENNKVYGLA